MPTHGCNNTFRVTAANPTGFRGGGGGGGGARVVGVAGVGAGGGYPSRPS